jgi:hypothetical protein
MTRSALESKGAWKGDSQEKHPPVVKCFCKVYFAKITNNWEIIYPAPFFGTIFVTANLLNGKKMDSEFTAIPGPIGFSLDVKGLRGQS